MASPAPAQGSDYFTRKISTGRIRPSPGGDAGSPRTPLFNRSLSGLYGSPGSGYRSDDENSIVIELGSRYLRVGTVGEPYPRCVLGFGPNEQRRVGDYRQWMPDYSPKNRKRKRGAVFGQEWELWRDDIRSLNLKLVEDKLERAVRKVDEEIIMLDDRKRKITLVISSDLSRPLLSIVLSVLFAQFQAPTITIFPTSIASVTSSGVRSGIVFDIGWAGTTATAVYEYREISKRRSIRGARTLCAALAKVLRDEYPRRADTTGDVSFDQAEEILTRFAWCRTGSKDGLSDNESNMSRTVDIPLPASHPPVMLSIPFNRLAEPAESVFFGKKSFMSDGYEKQPKVTKDGGPKFEANDHPLPLLLFETLLALPIDVRRSCMARIIFTGGGSYLPGVKSRLLFELESLVETRGWDHIHDYGKAIKITRSKPIGTAIGNTAGTSNADPNQSAERTESSTDKAQERDPIMATIDRQKLKGVPQTVEGEIRAVETLGAWAGGSLLAGLRIKGVVEIERESFMQHGLSGGAKDKEISKATHRQSFVPGARSGGGERTSWTLGTWA